MHIANLLNAMGKCKICGSYYFWDTLSILKFVDKGMSEVPDEFEGVCGNCLNVSMEK